jgi:hypothetical protein
MVVGPIPSMGEEKAWTYTGNTKRFLSSHLYERLGGGCCAKR